ncbi:MAG: hypothetical protein QOF01_4745 [Thermomicrobiales bacterium]|jgi:hypothetical protein|nr:hypothetical protein [Thermomicrobiales bacterium]MEA2598276.1 hypothetical protein [Thermomicrobiales bacterium]
MPGVGRREGGEEGRRRERCHTRLNASSDETVPDREGDNGSAGDQSEFRQDGGDVSPDDAEADVAGVRDLLVVRPSATSRKSSRSRGISETAPAGRIGARRAEDGYD